MLSQDGACDPDGGKMENTGVPLEGQTPGDPAPGLTRALTLASKIHSEPTEEGQNKSHAQPDLPKVGLSRERPQAAALAAGLRCPLGTRAWCRRAYHGPPLIPNVRGPAKHQPHACDSSASVSMGGGDRNSTAGPHGQGISSRKPSPSSLPPAPSLRPEGAVTEGKVQLRPRELGAPLGGSPYSPEKEADPGSRAP